MSQTECDRDGERAIHVYRRELQMCEELRELEPNSKWCLMQIIHLLKLIDANSDTSRQRIEAIATELSSIDPKRNKYFQHLKLSMDQ